MRFCLSIFKKKVRVRLNPFYKSTNVMNGNFHCSNINTLVNFVPPIPWSSSLVLVETFIDYFGLLHLAETVVVIHHGY